MAWTQLQKNQIFEAFWLTGRPRCPVDQAQLNVQKAHPNGGYTLTAFCPRCSSTLKMGNTEDPKRASFRAWTLAERKQLLADYLKTRSGTCPVCRAKVKMLCTASAEANRITMLCERCGAASVEHVLKEAPCAPSPILAAEPALVGARQWL